MAVTITSLSYTITDIQVFDNSDGTYLVKYEITDSSETYTISVVVNADTSATLTSTVTPVENIPYPKTSSMTVTSTATIGIS